MVEMKSPTDSLFFKPQMFKDARIEFNIVFPLAPTLKYLNISVRRLVLIIMKYGLQKTRKTLQY
jgi:ABC-type thiamine transport system ATPase subunit